MLRVGRPGSARAVGPTSRRPRTATAVIVMRTGRSWARVAERGIALHPGEDRGKGGYGGSTTQAVHSQLRASIAAMSSLRVSLITPSSDQRVDQTTDRGRNEIKANQHAGEPARATGNHADGDRSRRGRSPARG